MEKNIMNTNATVAMNLTAEQATLMLQTIVNGCINCEPLLSYGEYEGDRISLNIDEASVPMAKEFICTLLKQGAKLKDDNKSLIFAFNLFAKFFEDADLVKYLLANFDYSNFIPTWYEGDGFYADLNLEIASILVEYLKEKGKFNAAIEYASSNRGPSGLNAMVPTLFECKIAQKEQDTFEIALKYDEFDFARKALAANLVVHPCHSVVLDELNYFLFTDETTSHDRDWINLILNSGAFSSDELGLTSILSRAVYCGNETVVNLLLDYGVRLDVKQAQNIVNDLSEHTPNDKEKEIILKYPEILINCFEELAVADNAELFIKLFNWLDGIAEEWTDEFASKMSDACGSIYDDLIKEDSAVYRAMLESDLFEFEDED